MKKLIQIGACFCVITLLASCGKEFLDVRRDKKQVVPATLFDYDAILNNVPVINQHACYQLNVIGGDEFYVEDNVWDLLNYPDQKNAYIWADDVYEGVEVDNWDYGYEKILYANTVLDGLKGEKNELIGRALFLRGYAFYQLAQTFAPQYAPATAKETPGIPLRLEMDISLPVKRASLKETFLQIVSDVEAAALLLPLEAPLKFRPTRQAAYGLLAKTYMHMEDYAQALHYADSCIQLSDGLFDYNKVDPEARYTFAEYKYGENNPEVLYTELISSSTIVNSTRFCIDPDLYAMYDEADIRKVAYFFPTRDTYTFKGSYGGVYNFFGGIGLDEVVLLRAECLARLGDSQKAVDDLNYLLRNRYRMGEFVPLTAESEEHVMDLIIAERRKQLLCRGSRWEDLRRFNKESKYQTTVTRKLKGTTYELKPGDSRYTWPIPDYVVRMSEIPQNPR